MLLILEREHGEQGDSPKGGKRKISVRPKSRIHFRAVRGPQDLRGRDQSVSGE